MMRRRVVERELPFFEDDRTRNVGLGFVVFVLALILQGHSDVALAILAGVGLVWWSGWSIRD